MKHIKQDPTKQIAALQNTVAENWQANEHFALHLGSEVGALQARLDKLEQRAEAEDDHNRMVDDFNDKIDTDLEIVENRLDEVCDYLGVERVPYWHWNEAALEWDTGYILKTVSAPMPASSSYFTTMPNGQAIFIPSVFQPAGATFTIRSQG